jgi:uncharacterized protein (DUF2141 family)
MKLALTLLTLLLSVFAARSGLAQEKGYALTVTVTNIPGAKGNLLIGIYDSEASFTDEPLPISPKIPVTSTDDVNTTIEGLKPGTYAIAVIQDLNGNGELDRNFLGIPKEPLAFSVITEIPIKKVMEAIRERRCQRRLRRYSLTNRQSDRASIAPLVARLNRETTSAWLISCIVIPASAKEPSPLEAQ